jgi:proteasome beta subunit
MNKIMKTGTTTLAIKCKDGIILAADKRATAGNFIADKKVEKILEITSNMAITTAGSVSDIQMINKLIKAELRLKKVRTNRDVTTKEAANLLAGIVYQNIRAFSAIPGISQFIFAGVDNTGFHLYDIYPDGSLTESTDFVSTGSGSVMAYGVLETQYKPDISIEEATKLAIRSVNAALQRDSASGNGIDVAVIDKKGYRKLMTKELNTVIEA